MQKLKLLAGVCAVVLMSAGLGGCFSDLDSAVSNAAGLGTDKILGEIQQGMDNSEPVVNDKIDTWLSDNDLQCTVSETEICQAMSQQSDQDNCLAACGGAHP